MIVIVGLYLDIPYAFGNPPLGLEHIMYIFQVPRAVSPLNADVVAEFPVATGIVTVVPDGDVTTNDCTMTAAVPVCVDNGAVTLRLLTRAVDVNVEKLKLTVLVLAVSPGCRYTDAVVLAVLVFDAAITDIGCIQIINITLIIIAIFLPNFMIKSL